MTAYRNFEYTFDSDLGLTEMLAKLTEAGPWRWIDRDSDRYGFYISTSVLPRPQKAMIKILVDDDIDRFVVEVSIAADEEATAEEIERTLFDRLLPTIGARELREVDEVAPSATAVASAPSVSIVSEPQWLEVPAGEHEIGLRDGEARALAEAAAKQSREDVDADPDQLHGLREQWYLEQMWGNPDYLYAQLAHSMPAHRVTLPTCAIASQPVSYAEYERFRAATGAAPPAIFRGNIPAPTDPVTGIAWTEASAFAAWAGAELPLEAAWEVALRSISGSPFSAIGHALYEWCADEFGRYPGADRIAFGRIAPPPGGWFGTRTIRGGVIPGFHVTVIARRGGDPTLRLHDITFRLMRRHA
jgi:formylglycine-generating enzyme required for sulfatase activity